MRRDSETRKRIVLVGGGHTHAVLLRDAGQDFFSDFEVTLVSEDETTPYSGMMTGALNGRYDSEQILIPVAALARSRGATFLPGRVTAVDSENNFLKLGEKKLFYEALSINIGSRIDLSQVPGAEEWAVAIRPYVSYAAAIERLLKSASKGSVKIVQVGAGATGCECVAAIVGRFRKLGLPTNVTVIEKGNRLLPRAPERLARAFTKILAPCDYRFNDEVLRVTEGMVWLKSGERLNADLVSFALPPSAPQLCRVSGVRLAASGFIAINEKLQTSRWNILAAGDCAALASASLASEPPWPMAGVYAVKQAPILLHNLRATLTGQALQSFRPQRHWLSLLSDGQGRAMGWRGFGQLPLLLPHSVMTWYLKDWIDRRFIASIMHATNE